MGFCKKRAQEVEAASIDAHFRLFFGTLRLALQRRRRPELRWRRHDWTIGTAWNCSLSVGHVIKQSVRVRVFVMNRSFQSQRQGWIYMP